MTPKEKAMEIVEKFHDEIRSELMEDGEVSYYGKLAKQCALISVDELIKFALAYESIYYFRKGMKSPDVLFCEEVKRQIQNL